MLFKKNTLTIEDFDMNLKPFHTHTHMHKTLSSVNFLTGKFYQTFKKELPVLYKLLSYPAGGSVEWYSHCGNNLIVS